MLTQVQGGTSARLVAFSTLSATGTVRYTVPAGRTWRGHMWGLNGTQPGATFNGVQLNLTLNSTGSASVPVPLTLPAGTVVADSGNQGIGFIGVEE